MRAAGRKDRRMKTLYIECNMGAAGDMLSAALAELLPDPAAFTEKALAFFDEER